MSSFVWPSRLRLPPRAALRMVADAILLQFALISALVLRFGVLVYFEELGPTKPSEVVSRYLGWYATTAVPLTLLCLFVFYWTGFYTRGETYQSRYKILVVAQAISVSFLIYIGTIYFFNVYNGRLAFAKAAMLLAWGISIVLLAGARVWNQLWQRTTAHGHDTTLTKETGRDSRVLVIGGAGYIGSALVPMLLEQGYQVRVLDIMMFGDATLAGVREHPRLQIIKGDCRHTDDLVPAMRDVDTVVHLGAIVGDPACNLDESLTIDINLAATKWIAEEAKRQHVKRFVFASTCSVYGASPETLDERSEVRPLGIYGHTKFASEKILQGMADAHFQPTILRFATIYGFSGRTRFDLVVNLLTAKAKLDGEITVHDGDQWRPFVHVEDAARAIVTVLRAPIAVVGNEIFNVGANDQNFTIRQIGELIHEQVMSAKLIFSETAQDRRDYKVDFSKIRSLLDFQTTWRVERGIQQVLDAIASGKISDYRSPQYSNVAFLSREGTAGLARDRWARELIEDLANQG